MTHLRLRELQPSDEAMFIEAMQASRAFHSPWIFPPVDKDSFAAYIQKYQQPQHKSLLAVNDQDQLVGVCNLNYILRSAYQSAWLSFYSVAQFAGQGLMSRALQLLLKHVFMDMQLHRLEVNIQPKNERSINLVRRNGFRQEGFSPRFMEINGQWCDHERWAMTVEDWYHMQSS